MSLWKLENPQSDDWRLSEELLWTPEMASQLHRLSYSGELVFILEIQLIGWGSSMLQELNVLYSWSTDLSVYHLYRNI